ncbi:hypothetical protein [Clostridium botulinum]|uniref:hypothetical protein n=1 Tax=Clostridium botulinum TaxID=1491 RepID=UPI001C9A56B7|nr:hypothetical protein [Clostridium botulinum]MBY6811876.1 hypothetical protein [Clostridium botulinum]MBY6825358.1 hypothetical protein [Clostridium botulinum]MBY6835699.1 hypothetical protein [Clostridium botulinum]MBY6974389.1 hypothetical protein [Clostridium botulinum]MCS6105446.1 hypothetical protein [Clostridium botulinum]
MDKEIILHENLIEIDLFNEFWDYQKKYRESLYYLRSLKIALESIIVINRIEVEVNKVKDTINKLYNQCEVLINKYKNYEKSFYKENKKDNDIFNEIAITTTEDSLIYLEGKEILELTKTAIGLKSEIDKLQIGILSLLINESKNTIDTIIKGFKNLETQFLNEKNTRLLYIRNNHSVDEDRIVTYKINVNNIKLKKDFTSEKIQLPQCFKCTDYTYILDYKREEYRKFDDFVMQYIGLIEKEKKYISEKRKSNLQFFFNIMITISTITTLIINVFKFIYGK